MADHIDDSIRLGQQNVQTLELARRHCLKMEFEQSGGQGMLEAMTGLPINMRQVRCPVAIGNVMAMNLHGIATEFVRENCAGCSLRESTGEVPNLATVVAEEDAAMKAAAESDAKKAEAAREAWEARREARRALAAGASEPMVGVVTDIGLLDPDPAAEPDPSVQAAAMGRLNALADAAPELFTAEVVADAISLVVDLRLGVQVLDPLRRVALRRPEFGPQVAAAALIELRLRPSVPAGRCLADLIGNVTADEVDDHVCRSAIYLVLQR